MKKSSHRGKVIEHLVYPFTVPYPGGDRTYLASGFCQADEITTIYKRSVVEGDSDVSSVECAVCGGPVITYKDSSLLTSTYSPEIVGCLIQKDKTLHFVVETELSPFDSRTVEAVILAYLARHDFTASFQTISVYRSGVNSSLKRKLPPKKDLLYTQELKFISSEMLEEERESVSLAPEVKAAQDKEDKKRRKEMAVSAGKVLKELRKLSILPEDAGKLTGWDLIANSQKTLNPSSGKLQNRKETSPRRSMTDFAMKDSVYE